MFQNLIKLFQNASKCFRTYKTVLQVTNSSRCNQIVPELVQLFQNSSNCSRTHQTVPELVKLFQNSLNCSRTHQTIPELIKLFQNSLNCSRTHQTIPELIKLSHNSSNCSRTHQTLSELIQLFQISSNSFKTHQTVPQLIKHNLKQVKNTSHQAAKTVVCKWCPKWAIIMIINIKYVTHHYNHFMFCHWCLRHMVLHQTDHLHIYLQVIIYQFSYLAQELSCPCLSGPTAISALTYLAQKLYRSLLLAWQLLLLLLLIILLL